MRWVSLHAIDGFSDEKMKGCLNDPREREGGPRAECILISLCSLHTQSSQVSVRPVVSPRNSAGRCARLRAAALAGAASQPRCGSPTAGGFEAAGNLVATSCPAALPGLLGVCAGVGLWGDFCLSARLWLVGTGGPEQRSVREGGGRHGRWRRGLDCAELQLWVKGPGQGSMQGSAQRLWSHGKNTFRKRAPFRSCLAASDACLPCAAGVARGGLLQEALRDAPCGSHSLSQHAAGSQCDITQLRVCITPGTEPVRGRWGAFTAVHFLAQLPA